MMLFVEITSPEHLVTVLGQQNKMAYVVLFLGAFLETLIPVSLLVPGELFFLSGALLAGMEALNLWVVIAVLYAGGIIGDNISYWLGRCYGPSLFNCFEHWPIIGRLIHNGNYRRGSEFFRRRGAMAVFTARLSGPLSWITPAMAGIFRLNYGTFLRFNTLGVIIGIGEFIVIGYFFGGHIAVIVEWLQRFIVSIAIAACITLGVFFLYFLAAPREV